MKQKRPEKFKPIPAPAPTAPAAAPALTPAVPVEEMPVGKQLPVSNEDQQLLLQLQKAAVTDEQEFANWLLAVELEKQQRHQRRHQLQQNLINATKTAAERAGVDLKTHGLWTWVSDKQIFERTR